MCACENRVRRPSPTLDEALACIARGWAVFPVHGIRRDGVCTCGNPQCEHPGKHPRVTHGLKDGSKDPDVVRRWFSASDSNLGIVTGAESNLLVLDNDPRHSGDETLAELVRKYGPLPATVQVLTGGGGSHDYFRHPGGRVRCKADALGPGLDLKGDGGYVVGPSSMHVSGRRYEWEISSHPDEVDIAEAPKWLLERVRALESLSKDRRESGVIPNHQRNDTLASLAGSMRRRGMTAGSILAALLVENRTRCQPPLSDNEVKIIAGSISRYQPGASRDTYCAVSSRTPMHIATVDELLATEAGE